MATIEELQLEIIDNTGTAVRGIDSLSASLGRLKSASSGGAGLTTTVNQLKKLAEGVRALNSAVIPTEKINGIIAALRPLESLGKTNLTSTLNALKKLPEMTKMLGAMDMDKFATQIQRVTTSIAPLANEMAKVAAGFSALPSKIQKIIQSTDRLSASNSRAKGSYGILGTGISRFQAKMGIYFFALRRLSSAMSEWVVESNDYVENMNLFTVAMGDAAPAALKYAEAARDALGIDVSDFIRNQGIFKQVASGFGVMEQKANLMSKNLTQLGYDISSFYNIPIETAMLKVQSGISGELEPLRRLGYALDIATLQQIAYANGIDMSINKMTQAQKSQLRYVAIMQQSKNVMGDMARTVLTPANAMRILSQQVTQLKRALGNVLIPILIQIVPYVQAFVIVLTQAAQALANLLGFELPTIDYTGLGDASTGAGELDDSLGGAADNAKTLKNALMGFDELNILPAPDAGAKGGGAGSVGGGMDLPLDLPGYDFLEGAANRTKEIVEQMREPFAKLLKIVGLIGVSILGWKIGAGLGAFITMFLPGGAIATMATTLGITTGILVGIIGLFAAMVTRIADLTTRSENFRKGVAFIFETFEVGWTWLRLTVAAAAEWFLALFPTALVGKFAGFFSGISKWLSDLDLDWIDLLATFGGIALLFTPAAPFGLAILIFEAITVAIRVLGEYVDILREKFRQLNERFDTLRSAYSTAWAGFYTEVSRSWGNLLTWFGTSVFPIFTMAYWRTKFWGMVDGARETLAELRRTFESFSVNIKTPHITWTSNGQQTEGFTQRILEALGLPTRLPKLNVSWYAGGGFPELGEMFVARESGPEMVGSIGGKTAVANNDQIVEAVSQGVYSAVRQAMGSGGDTTIIVKVGEDTLVEKVVKGINRNSTVSGRTVIHV